MKNHSKCSLLFVLAAGVFAMHACKKTSNENLSVKNTVNKKVDSVPIVITRGPKIQSFDNHLIAYLPLDNNAKDVSGNGYTSTIMGSVTGSLDQYNLPGAMHFSGVSTARNYIKVSDSPNLRLSGFTYSINVWVRVDSLNSNGSQIVSKRSSMSGAWGLSITGSSFLGGSGHSGGAGRVYYGPGGGTNYASSTSAVFASSTSWHMITIIYRYGGSSNSVDTYIDGSFDSTWTGLGVANSVDTAHMTIGNDPLNYYQFRGDMDDLRIYNIALTPTQISSLYGIHDTYNLTAYWPLGGNSNDYSGNSHNATTTNITGYTIGHLGNTNGASSFNGTSNYIEVPDASDLNFSANTTVNAWVYLNAMPTSGLAQVVSKRSSTLGWALGINSSSEPYLSVRNTGFSAGTPIGTGGWHMLTVTYDKLHNVDSLYIDGSFANEFTSPPLVYPGAPAVNLFIGKDNLSSGYFNGYIDDVKIFKRRLYSPEVANLYTIHY